MAERVGWLDAAKCLGIALVVFGHVERGLNSAGLVEAPAWRLIDFYIYTFHMPLFMYLAGTNVPGSLAKPNFLKRKAASILHPYVVWSLIQGGVMVVLSSQTNGDTSIADLLAIGWDPISPFWFLYVLFVYMAVVSVLPPSRALLAGAAALLAVSPVIEPELLFQLAYFFFFFLLGVCFPARETPRWAAPVALAGCLLWTWMLLSLGAVSMEAGSAGWRFYSPLLLPSALLGILAMLSLARSLDFAWLRHAGQASMAIYVMHILATAGSRILLQKAFGVTDPILHLVAGVVLGIGLPLLAYEVMRRLGLAWWLGLGGAQPVLRGEAMTTK